MKKREMAEREEEDLVDILSFSSYNIY